MSVFPAPKSPLYNERLGSLGEDCMRNMLSLTFPKGKLVDNGIDARKGKIGKKRYANGPDYFLTNYELKSAEEVKFINKTAKHVLGMGWLNGQVLPRFEGFPTNYQKFLVTVGARPQLSYKARKLLRLNRVKHIHIPMRESLLKVIESLAEDNSGLFEKAFSFFVKQVVTPDNLSLLKEGMSGLMSLVIEGIRVFPIQLGKDIITIIQRIYSGFASIDGRFDDIRIRNTFLMHSLYQRHPSGHSS
jgi:hypothetical protein